MANTHSGTVSPTSSIAPPHSSPDPHFSALSRRHRTTDSIDGNSDIPTPQASPSLTATKARLAIYRYGDSSKTKTIDNLEINNDSVKSNHASMSGVSRYSLNVSDWNEKPGGELKSTSMELQTRYGADPPRPPKEGHEWVWFSEGYWAEREKVEHMPRNRWFSRSSRQQSRDSSKTKPIYKDPRKTSGGGSKSSPNSSQNDIAGGDNIGTMTPPDSRGSRFRSGLRYSSPFRPFFIHSTYERGGLHSRMKRWLSRRRKLVSCDLN